MNNENGRIKRDFKLVKDRDFMITMRIRFWVFTEHKQREKLFLFFLSLSLSLVRCVSKKYSETEEKL